jgi:hypothetical protein
MGNKFFFFFIGEAGPGGGVPEGEGAGPEQPGGGTPVAAPGGGGEDQHGGSTAPGTVPEPISVAAPGDGGEDQHGHGGSTAPGTVLEFISVAAPGGGGEDQHEGTTAPGTVLEPIRILLVKHGDPDPTLLNRPDLTPYVLCFRRKWFPYIQRVTKRFLLSLLTNSALVYESLCGAWGRVAGSQPMRTAVHMT